MSDPIDTPCLACLAEAGEPCRPNCISEVPSRPQDDYDPCPTCDCDICQCDAMYDAWRER